MSVSKPKIIVIAGPTTSGKTALSIKLAKKHNGEIVSADSRQVYKYINLASGKVTKTEMSKIPHHLIDVVSPKNIFTVSDYQNLAKKTIDDIVKRGKTPIICGGTGFYINALLNDIQFPKVEPNRKLRDDLGRKTANELFEQLQNLDPERAETIDQQNRVRLIRAIEIATAIGKTEKLTYGPDALLKKYDVKLIYVDLPDEVLFNKILARIKQRIKRGMIKEVENLHKKHGVSWKRLYEIGLESRHISMYLRKEISRKQMIENLLGATKKYVKRQRVWFKKYLNIQPS